MKMLCPIKIYLFILFCICITYNSNGQQVCIAISTSSDDAEEATATGIVELNSGDLDLCYHPVDGDLVVGLRFNNFVIPPSSTIISAYIQFVADETHSNALTYSIWGHDVDNSGTFTLGPYNISNRTKTNASISWSPSSWVTGQAGAAQQTTDISQVLNEIVARPGFNSGNSVSFLIESTSTFKRAAETYDSGQEAQLCYEICTIGASCNDNNACTTNDTFQPDCTCVGTTVPDSDNDGLCDAIDPCPNTSLNDSDNDGVCDNVDICIGYDDNIDNDNDGIPDGCDPCIDVNSNGICDDVDPDFAKVVINEINYRSIDPEENIDFIEIYNNDNQSVDLSNWTLTDGINFQFPSGTNLAAGGYLVVAGNPSDCMAAFGFSNAYGPYSGNLSGGGDKVELRNSNFGVVDDLSYESWKEWPCVRHLNNGDTPASIQKTHPSLNSKHPGSWEAAYPTPKAVNNGVLISNPLDRPIIKSVSKSPDKPTSSEAVRIKADLKNIDSLSGTLTVTLEYQRMNAGSYIKKSDAAYSTNWTALPMNDNGTGPDSTANNGVYTGLIPASLHNHRMLVRYRVKVTTSNGFFKIYPDQNFEESNYAYYVYNGDAPMNGYDLSTLPVMEDFTLISTETAINTFVGNGSDNFQQYQGYLYGGEGTVVYQGKVYDHIGFRPRGGNSRRSRVKPGLKLDMNREHTFAPVDDCGEKYNEKRGKIRLSGTWVNDIGGHGLTESITYKLLELSGGLPRATDYTVLRIVDTQTETGNSGDFWGIFLIQEDFNGDYIDEHKLPPGNFWTTDRTTRDRVLDYQGEFAGSSTQPTFAPANQNNGAYTLNSNGDLPMLFGEKVAAVTFGMYATNYIGKHSYSEYYNSETGKYHAWWGDMDNAFGCPIDDYFSFPRSQALLNANYTNEMNVPASMVLAYQAQFRSFYDLMLSQEQREFLVDNEVKKIYSQGTSDDWAEVDHSRWSIYQTYDEGSFDNHVSWYKSWFQNRAIYIANNSSDGIYDANIPLKPTVSLTGTTALDNIVLSNSNFSGFNAFSKLEWRIGEWSDPSNPIYNGCEPIYEVEHLWKSGEQAFSNSFTVPGTANLEVGKTYKIRVRYKDVIGRWSHWSSPVTVVPSPPTSYVGPNLLINEFLYNPSGACGQEFIEIYNNTPNFVSLESFKFSEGVRYNFPPSAAIAAYDYYVIARDSVEFYYQYGFYPDGDYAGSLENNGETLKLTGLYNVLLDSVAYSSDLRIWDEAADRDGAALELLNPNYNNNDPLSWFRSDNKCGSPGAMNSRICSGISDQIVINEINYNSGSTFDPGEWIELHNPGSSSVNISDWTLYDGTRKFIFPNNTVLGPGEFLVMSNDTTKFKAGFPNVPNFMGQLPYNLGNGGERISLFDENKCLSDYVVYDDVAPWSIEPDGYGATLSLKAPNLDNAQAASWETSNNINAPNGTPGRANTPCPVLNITTSGTVCTITPETFYISSLPGATHSWSIPNASPNSGVGDSITVVFANPGLEFIQVTTTYFECTITTSKLVNSENCNTAPTGVNDSFSLDEDTSLNAADVLSNDTDPEGQNLVVELPVASLPSNGTLTMSSTGIFTYVPIGNFNGQDQFTYKVCDDGTPQLCDLVTVNLTVNPVNDIPTPLADFITTDEDVIRYSDASTNDYDIDGDNLTLSIVSQPNNGAALMYPDGTFSYDPTLNYSGPDVFTYKV